MNRAFPENESSGDDGDGIELQLNFSDDMIELLRRRYRESHDGEDPPDDDALAQFCVRIALISSLLDPELNELLRADAELSDEDRETVRSFMERCISEAVANDREVDPGIKGPLTPESLLDQARKIQEN